MGLLNYNYWCKNPQCDNKLPMETIRKDETEANNPEACSICGQEMKLMGYSSSGGFMRFGSSTPAQRAAVLKERSHAHYEKEIKEKKHEMLKDSFRKGIN